jgi:hypothetical protein
MHTAGRISLEARDVLSLSHLKAALPRRQFPRFRSLIEGGCAPIHFGSKDKARPSNVFLTPTPGYPPAPIRLPEEAGSRAGAIGGAGRSVLCAVSCGHLGPDISFLVKTATARQAAALVGLRLGEAAGAGFPLETLTQMVAGEGKKRVLLLSGSGLSIDSTSLTEANCGSLWRESAEGMAGGEGRGAQYVCSMVGTGPSGGPLTTIALAESRPMPGEAVRLASPLGFFDAVAMEKRALASYLREKRDSLTPALLTGIVTIGYMEFGPSFLRLAGG